MQLLWFCEEKQALGIISAFFESEDILSLGLKIEFYYEHCVLTIIENI